MYRGIGFLPLISVRVIQVLHSGTVNGLTRHHTFNGECMTLRWAESYICCITW